jgi:hypothetical protein
LKNAFNLQEKECSRNGVPRTKPRLINWSYQICQFWPSRVILPESSLHSGEKSVSVEPMLW